MHPMDQYIPTCRLSVPLQGPRREGMVGLPDAWGKRWRTFRPRQWPMATWQPDKGRRGDAPRAVGTDGRSPDDGSRGLLMWGENGSAKVCHGSGGTAFPMPSAQR